MKKRDELVDAIARATPMNADFQVGLTEAQIGDRVAAGLLNATKKHHNKSYAQICFDNVFSFFNILLVSIGILMLIAKRPWPSFFFLLILFANMFIGLFEDIHARHLVDKLRVITDAKAKVVRSSLHLSIPTDQVVLSDILLLDTGDQVCSDCRLLDGKLSVDESLLTGESQPVAKVIGDEVHSGCYVVSGHGSLRVISVGNANFAETIQNQAKNFTRPQSEIKRTTLLIFWTTGITSICIGLFDLLAWAVRQRFETFISFQQFVGGLSGMMVAMIPAGMYLLTSLTLAVGVVSLATKRTLVQELYSLEMLARVDVLCLDKTGTLTDGTMNVKDMYNFSKQTDEEIGNSVASLLACTHDGNSTAIALRTKYGEDKNAVAEHVIPFDSANKFSAVTLKGRGTYILGALEFVDAKANDEASWRIGSASQRGYRCLCFFHNDKAILKGNALPRGSVILAVFVLSDHIKEDAKANIDWFKKNGVDVRVISGDSPATVSEVASEVGIENAANYISLQGVPLDKVGSLVAGHSVFGRVSPEQKAEIIKTLQKQGHKVAMTGDGVNDIIALKTADCSIAMASGSEAARSVSHLISLDNGFSRLPSVVDEGRRVINNLQRTCSLFLSKTIFAIIVSLAFMISFMITGNIEGAYPFRTENMLVWEIVTIGFAAFFLALQPSHERLKGSFLENILNNSIAAGLAEISCVLLAFVISRINPSFLSLANAKTLSVLSFTAISYVVLFRISMPFNTYRSVLFGSLLALGVGVVTLDYSLRWNFFGIDYYGLSWQIWVALALIVIVCGGLYFLLDWLLHLAVKKVHKGAEQ